jgi:MFS family permease
MTPILKRILGRVFYGWWIVGLASLIQAVGGGILYQSFTVFFLPLRRDLGVSSWAISLLYGAARLEGGFEGPVVGYLIDRLGSRSLIIIGGGMAGTGLILLSTVHSYLSFFLIYNQNNFRPLDPNCLAQAFLASPRPSPLGG